MVEMRGPQLVQVLRKKGRPVRVLYVTGYAEEGVEDTLGEPVLSKPFTPNELMRAVSELLAE
jgi:CheY-like chemotaxis protein